VVGIINMVFVKGTKETVLSQPSGIAYAIPIQPLIQMLRQITAP
jgi:serine protease Do